MISKYSESTLEKAINMELEYKNNIYYVLPISDKDVFKHKIILHKIKGPICGCRWSQINLNKGLNKKLCSHALAVLFQTDKNKFWKEVSKFHKL